MNHPDNYKEAYEQMVGLFTALKSKYKDCRHRDPEDHKCDCGQLERAGCVFPVDDDYFCAYGER